MTPAKMSKVESAIRAALAYREAFNNHDTENMLRLFCDQCIVETHHPAPHGLTINGKEALLQYWQEVFSTFPGIRLDIEEVFGFGERCIMRWKLGWMDENGIAEYLRGIDIFKTGNDLICEKYTYGKSGKIV